MPPITLLVLWVLFLESSQALFLGDKHSPIWQTATNLVLEWTASKDFPCAVVVVVDDGLNQGFIATLSTMVVQTVVLSVLKRATLNSACDNF